MGPICEEVFSALGEHYGLLEGLTPPERHLLHAFVHAATSYGLSDMEGQPSGALELMCACVRVMAPTTRPIAISAVSTLIEGAPRYRLEAALAEAAGSVQ